MVGWELERAPETGLLYTRMTFVVRPPCGDSRCTDSKRLPILFALSVKFIEFLFISINYCFCKCTRANKISQHHNRWRMGPWYQGSGSGTQVRGTQSCTILWFVYSISIVWIVPKIALDHGCRTTVVQFDFLWNTKSFILYFGEWSKENR